MEVDSETIDGESPGDDRKKKARGIPKPIEVFRFLDISVSTDGTQWIMFDGSNRSYFTNLDSLFMKVINLHLHRLRKDDREMVTSFVDVLKRGWAECRALAKAIEDKVAKLQGSVRDGSE